MKNTIKALILLSFWPYICWGQGWGEGFNRLILSPGERIQLPLPPDLKVRVGDKSLLSIKIEEGELLLLARKTGQSLLVAGAKSYQVVILSPQQKAKALILEELFKNTWGLEWSVTKDQKLTITGKLYRLWDWLELSKQAKAHNIQYEFKALPTEGLKPVIQYYFKQLFKNKGLIPPEIGDKALAYIPQGLLVSKYKKLLKPFGLTPEIDPLWFSTAPFVEIQLAVVEIINSSGVYLGGEGEGPKLSFSSLLSFLNFLKSSGKGKTLHHSSLIGQSGREIHIHSGGQIPFHNYNFKTEQKTLNWKSHGLELKILPKVGKKQQIELKIRAKISQPITLGAKDSPPSLKSQSLEHTLTLKNKEIVRLFKLKKQAMGKQGQLGGSFVTDFSPTAFKSKQEYKNQQFIFIQATIKQ